MSTFTHRKLANSSEVMPGLHITHSVPGELEQYEQDIKSHSTQNIYDLSWDWDEVHSKVGALASHMVTHYSPKDGVDFIPNEVISAVGGADTRDGEAEPNTLDVAAFLEQHVKQ